MVRGEQADMARLGAGAAAYPNDVQGSAALGEVPTKVLISDKRILPADATAVAMTVIGEVTDPSGKWVDATWLVNLQSIDGQWRVTRVAPG